MGPGPLLPFGKDPESGPQGPGTRYRQRKGPRLPNPTLLRRVCPGPQDLVGVGPRKSEPRNPTPTGFGVTGKYADFPAPPSASVTVTPVTALCQESLG